MWDDDDARAWRDLFWGLVGAAGLIVAVVLVVLYAVGCGDDIAYAACSHKGQSCRTTADCCPNEGLICQNGCRLGTTGTTRPPTTTVPSVTTSTLPTPTTSTLPPVVLTGVPSRWETPEFVSRAYRDSQSILWDPRARGPVQEYATQYDRQMRVETMWGPFFAEVLGFICTQGTDQQCTHAVTLTKQVVKFVVRYNFRDPGEPYGWGPNYVWDNWQAMLGIAADVYGPRPPTIAALVRTDYVIRPRGVKVPSRDREGIFDPHITFAPLSSVQADALDAAAAAHDRHAQALLDWLTARRDGLPADVVAQRKATADALAPAVRATQAAFAATARDRYEATIFDQVFAGGLAIVPGDGFADVGRAIRLTEQTIAAHHLWMGGFNARTGRPPNQSLIILAMWKHWLVHLRRAVPVPLLMAQPLFGDDERTVTGSRWASLYPKCTRAAVLAGTYDVHYCPDLIE